MATKSDHIKVTPLVGGRLADGVCSLLEIGGVRLLLDCGCSPENSLSQLTQIAHDLKQIGGVNAVLLSHADIHHLGALPVVFGRQGLADVPVICTSPVYKFGQITLYDHILNKGMEGTDDVAMYGFDDVDQSFSKHVTIKFNQSVVIPDREGITRYGPQVSVCAVRSGRTLGGSIWKIRCGPTEIVYAMDINLKKEIILDGMSMDLLPASPALMIAEGGCVSRSTNVTVSNDVTRRSSKKDKDDNNVLINAVMETMRAGGNVLIPMETAGRALELLQILGKYWYDQKLGLYNLIFLSHMAKNVPEFARMQLEWMSDSLSRGFYNGKPNPFDLPQIRFATSLREIEKFCPGPKCVLATDAGMSSGLSKELLLKWGGDPRCRVIFMDASDPGSLAAELRQKYASPPVIATITRPIRVELAGEELVAYRLEQEKQRRLREEAVQRKRRQEELSMFNVTGDVELVDDEDDSTGTATAEAAARTGPNGSSNNGAESTSRKKVKVDILKKFLEPSFSMFENLETQVTVDEYGASIDDLQFKDIQTIDTKWMTMKDKNPDGTLKSGGPGGPNGGGPPSAGAAAHVGSSASSNGSAEEAAEEAPVVDPSAVPTKLVASSLRVQFTCEFKELNLSGRADFKAIKTVISKVTPTRLLILRGNDADCSSLLTYAKANGIEGFAPRNRSTVAFEVHSEKLRVQIPQSLMPSSMRAVRLFSSTANALIDTKCSVTAIAGLLEESKSLAQEGTRLVKYQGEQENENEGEEKVNELEATTTREQKLNLRDGSIGVVSVGEVTLNSLGQLIGASGTSVEFRIDSRGAVLVCGEQVLIRKENTSDFAIEGPPVPAFYEARKALYQQFAFV